MSLPITQPIPDPSERPTTPLHSSPPPASPPAPVRRRRGRRPLIPAEAGPRFELLERLAYQITPSLDYYLFSLACGIVLGIAILFDTTTLLVLAALVAPFMAPPIGLSMAAVLGSWRFFTFTLLSGLVGTLLVFLCGLLSGLAARSIPQASYPSIDHLTSVSWSGFVLVSAGMVLSILSLVRTNKKSLVPSVGLAYTLYLPVGVAGFGLTSGVSGFWPGGLTACLAYTAWAVLLGAILFTVLGFWPHSVIGAVFSGTISLASLTLLLGLGTYAGFFPGLPLPWSGKQLNLRDLPGLFSPTATDAVAQTASSEVPVFTNTPVHTSTAIPSPILSPSPYPTSTTAPSHTPALPTMTSIPTHTLVPSRTPTLTLTPAPTPVWAIVNAPEYDGAYIREEPRPDGRIITSLLNGTLVEVLPEVVPRGSMFWSHVRTIEGVEGWIVQSLLMTATPAPNW